MPEIPDKLYFRIGEVARLLSIEPYTLRFWESEFPQLKPGKGGTGQRLYRRRDVETLLQIKRLLYVEGYTIPGARQFLKTAGAKVEVKPPAEAAPEVKKPITPNALRLRKIKSDLREIASLLERPSPGTRRGANPAHRGLAVTPRRRENIVEMPPPLFAASIDPPTE